ncbi:MAG: hypothetical protein ACOH2H_23535 [Cypionkella sp.]
MVGPLTAEELLFLIVGSVILIYEGHRLFNERSYKAPDGVDDSEFIYQLAPSEIRNRSAYFSAELLYIGVIYLAYVLFLYSDAFNAVVMTIIHLVSGGVKVGGEVAGTVATVPPDAATAVKPADVSVIDRSAMPLVVSLAVVAALRLPWVQRLEVVLRTFSQNLFGIPTIPVRLRQKIEDTDIDLAEIEKDLPANLQSQHLADKAASYVEAARSQLEGGGSDLDLEGFRRFLAKIFAYRIWVNDLRLWPLADFQARSSFFRSLNQKLLAEIGALKKDLDHLSATPVEPKGAVPTADEEAAMNLQRDLWELKVGQANNLSRQASNLMALFDQNSNWPTAEKSGAPALRAFLSVVRSDDDIGVAQVNLAIILVLASTSVNAVAGAVHAMRYGAIANALNLGNVLNAAQFDQFLTAINFAVTSLIVYGLSMWVAIHYRRGLMLAGKWVPAFDLKGQVPPMTQFVKLGVLAAAAVLLANFFYVYGQSIGWTFSGLSSADLSGVNGQRQFSLSVALALVGAVHGTAVALILDLGKPQFESRFWMVVVICYIAVMAVVGYSLGSYISSESLNGPLPAGLDEDLRQRLEQMRPMVLHMRQIIYAFNLALVAIFTSLAITNFARPKGAARPVVSVLQPGKP